jgi:hypothetical protein
VVIFKAEHVFAKQDSKLNGMYLKWMLAHLKNREWLCCYHGPVAYALMADRCRPPANLRRRRGDHEFALVAKEQGTTEHTETTEAGHNRREDRFRVFGVFCG